MHTSLASKRQGNFLVLEDQEVKHLKVKRLKVGDKLLVIWDGALFLCKLEKIDRVKALCRIIRELETKEPPVKVTIYQAIPVELKTMDTIVQKCTEIGVDRIVPLITQRSFQDVRTIEKKLPRWEKIVRESMKQSKRPKALTIERAINLRDIPPPREVGIVLDNFLADTPIRDIKANHEVEVVVGPEGGFAKDEVSLLKERGYIPVILEGYTYRTETATIVAAGFLINSAGF